MMGLPPSNDKRFHHSQYVNSWNIHARSTENPYGVQETLEHPLNTAVWCAMI
jgi:hypothetical protein